MDVKPASDWSANWEASHGRVASAYKKGIDRNTSWHQNAIDGQKNYEEKMSDSSVLARRAEKLQEVDQGKWKARAGDKGAKNIVTGMKAGTSDYATAASKSASALAGVTLPEKTVDPYENLMNRGGATIRALRQAWGKE